MVLFLASLVGLLNTITFLYLVEGPFAIELFLPLILLGSYCGRAGLVATTCLLPAFLINLLSSSSVGEFVAVSYLLVWGACLIPAACRTVSAEFGTTTRRFLFMGAATVLLLAGWSSCFSLFAQELGYPQGVMESEAVYAEASFAGLAGVLARFAYRPIEATPERYEISESPFKVLVRVSLGVVLVVSPLAIFLARSVTWLALAAILALFLRLQRAGLAPCFVPRGMRETARRRVALVWMIGLGGSAGLSLVVSQALDMSLENTVGVMMVAAFSIAILTEVSNSHLTSREAGA